MGAEGTQFRCSTVYKTEWTNPKVAAGGGFGVELFTLNYLYQENKAKIIFGLLQMQTKTYVDILGAKLPFTDIQNRLYYILQYTTTFYYHQIHLS